MVWSSGGSLKGGEFLRLLGILLCCLAHRGFGLEIALSGLTSASLLMTLVVGPFSVGALVKLAAFLSSLSWPSEVFDLGTGRISYVKLLILYERWAGERLRVEDSIPKYRRPGRPISVSAAPLCPDADIWKLRRFLGNMMRALRGLPGGLGRFIPGRIGADHGRLRHIDWEKCYHGLTCRPRESSGNGFSVIF